MSTTAAPLRSFQDRLHAHLGRLAEDPAALAALRRSLSRPPGEAPEAWPHLVPLVGDDDRRFEAVAVALGLFALHQQGQARPMHARRETTPGRATLGSALAALRARRAEADAAGIERRFVAAVATENLEQLAVHLRGLVTMLRAEAIPLDYVRLQEDLQRWRHPGARSRVRRRWGLDFYGQSGADGEEPQAQPTTEGS